jgi:hypothetical protein
VAEITLSAEQKAKIPAWFEKWFQVSICTEPADRPRAEAAIKEIYAMRNLGVPEILWAASPIAAMDMAEGMRVTNAFRGQNDAYWCGLYLFCEQELGKKYDAERSRALHLWAELAQSCHWWWGFERGVVVCDRPRIVSLDDKRRAHSDIGPAIAFRDKMEIHCWHGIVVPKLVIETPEKITPKMIRDQSNQEIRRIMIQRFGGERFIRDFGCKETHRDDFGVLYHGQDRGRDIAYVKVVNGTKGPDGSYKNYFLSVHPQHRTALAAVASTYRDEANQPMTAEKYLRILART